MLLKNRVADYQKPSMVIDGKQNSKTEGEGMEKIQL